ncbi:MAG: 16S rRNA (guanine(527)-N(7))-methyltransferase RsmG [Desulfomonilaceae bacterium]
MIQPFRSLDPEFIIKEGSTLLGISVSNEIVSKMMKHMRLLVDWSSRINLTALTDPRDIAVLHFLDSLAVFKVVPRSCSLSILDVGSGAGFPGIVMRTLEESIDLTVLDRNPKKIVFLKYLAKELNFSGVRFLNFHLKELLDEHFTGLFDLAISRAFSSDPHLLNALHVLLPLGGSLVRMAGPGSMKRAFRLQNFEESSRWEGSLPFSNSFRSVLRYTKIR